MTYQITASPIKGQKETKTVEGVRGLHAALAEYSALGYEIKDISRPSKVLNLLRRFQLAW